jgi:hypothetical protein
MMAEGDWAKFYCSIRKADRNSSARKEGRMLSVICLQKKVRVITGNTQAIYLSLNFILEGEK